MNIVIATPILHDKTSPFNHLFKDILEGFLNAGHEVVRIVAVEDDKDTGYTLGIANPSVTYYPVFRKAQERGNIIKRYLTDIITTIKMARKIRHLDSGDVLFEDVCYSSFCTVRAAKKKGMRVVVMVQDIWPDNAVQSGLIGDRSLIYRYFECHQRFVYRCADQIICISDDMKQFLVAKGLEEKKIDVIYNWGYNDELVNIPWEGNEFVKKYSLDPSKFYAIYAGNIGKMQNVEIVVEVARLLKENDKIRFLIIGDGTRRGAIEKLISEYSLPNLLMLPLQPPELATSIYSAAGVNIIPLVPDGVKTAMPSKTGIVLSCGRPAIFAFGSDCAFAKVVDEYDAGSCVSAKFAEELAEAVLGWSNDKEGTNTGAYKLFQDYFVKSGNVGKYVENLGWSIER